MSGAAPSAESKPRPRKDPGVWVNSEGEVEIPPGGRGDVELTAGYSYSGMNVTIPVHVWRGAEPGPCLAVTAAVHGDELNGTGAIRRVLLGDGPTVKRGTLVMVPIVNVLAFEQHSRYLPDRRDLNRCFPGSKSGSMAGRFARTIFDEIVQRADFIIDLHTAAVRRTNFPNVRADMNDPALAAFARAFGSELIVHGRGPVGSLRRAACQAGCPTLILEAGEVWKVEPVVVEYAVRGIKNAMMHLGMIDGSPEAPPYQIEVDKTKWVRSEHAGFLQFHVAPGDTVDKGQPLATSSGLTGREEHVIPAPRSGIVLGMTTIPAVAPGGPVCHLAYPSSGQFDHVERIVAALPDDSLHERIRSDLSTNFEITEEEPDPS